MSTCAPGCLIVPCPSGDEPTLNLFSSSYPRTLAGEALLLFLLYSLSDGRMPSLACQVSAWFAQLFHQYMPHFHVLFHRLFPGCFWDHLGAYFLFFSSQYCFPVPLFPGWEISLCLYPAPGVSSRVLIPQETAPSQCPAGTTRGTDKISPG